MSSFHQQQGFCHSTTSGVSISTGRTHSTGTSSHTSQGHSALLESPRELSGLMRSLLRLCSREHQCKPVRCMSQGLLLVLLSEASKFSADTQDKIHALVSQLADSETLKYVASPLEQLRPPSSSDVL